MVVSAADFYDFQTEANPNWGLSITVACCASKISDGEIVWI